MKNLILLCLAFSLSRPAFAARPADCGFSLLSRGAAVVGLATLLATNPAGAGEDSVLAPHATQVTLSNGTVYANFHRWHPAPRATILNKYDLKSLGDFTGEVYLSSKFGAQVLNAAPEDVQGELRLVNLNPGGVRPVDPVIPILSVTDAEWMARAEPILAHLDDLHVLLGDVDDTIAQQGQANDLRAEITTGKESLKFGKNLLARLEIQKLKAVERFGEINYKFRAAETAVENAKSGSQLCRYLGQIWMMGWVCEVAAAKEKSSLVSLGPEHSDAFKAVLETNTKYNLAKDNKEALEITVAQKQASLDALTRTLTKGAIETFARQTRLQNELLQATSEAHTLTGFVRSPFPGAMGATCATPLVYRSFPSVETFGNPLLGHDADVRLEPKPTLSLHVCLDANSRLSQVHIFENERDRLHSEITRDPTGRIDEIVIFNEGGQVLEDHRWFPLPDGGTRYMLSWTDPDSADTVSIYADFYTKN